MGNILSYLKWRGDLTFRERPFCEVDNLVLAELSYLDFSGLVPTVEQGGSVSLAQAAEGYDVALRKVQNVNGLPDDFLPLMARSNRFRDVRLSHYADILDRETGVQFAALHIALGDGTVYVAFRGTSDDLIGWREDFSMSFQLMPAQTLAAAYLSETLCEPGVKYRIGGHSKGGSLAVYAAMMCSAEQKEQIIAVYSNDGPGICDELLDREKYQELQPKLTRIVPEFSVIGSLFAQEPPTKIVASSASGISQHEGMSWEVEGDHFCIREDLSPKCLLVNNIFRTWIESASMEQRKTFTNDFFDALESSGVKQLSELTERNMDEVETILLSLTCNTDKESKTVAAKFLLSAFQVVRSIPFGDCLKSSEAICGGVSFLLGLLFMIAPDISSRCVGIGICVILLTVICRQIVKGTEKKTDRSTLYRIKLIAQLVLLCAVSFLSAVVNLVFNFTNLLVGVGFLLAAFTTLKKTFSEPRPRGRKIINYITAAVEVMLGIVPIVSKGLQLESYAFAAGTFILIFGMIEIVRTMYLAGKRQMEETSQMRDNGVI